MRLSLRFILPLVLVLAGVAYIVAPLLDRQTVQWFTKDLDMRATLIATTVEEQVATLAASGDRTELRQYFERLAQDERLFAIGYCAAASDPLIASTSMPTTLSCEHLDQFDAASPQANLQHSLSGPLLVSVRALRVVGESTPRLVLVHDMSFVTRRSAESRRYLFVIFIALALLVSLITVVVAHLSWRGWVNSLRSLVRGDALLKRPLLRERPELQPIASDLRALIRDIQSEHRTREDGQASWNPEALRAILDGELRGQQVIVVSNREPYMHVHEGDRVVIKQPASGVVTALEPIMRACAGTWIAHGSGSADRESVDRKNHVMVPVGEPAYTLRRVWLTEVEEEGYYYGFANEGLWPLCHNAHVRPTFRAADWAQYVAVNKKFAQAVVDEATSADPIVLVQDYHFALLPRYVRELLPAATIITFWHIPWPNPEAFGICPWREELLDGLLGSSILGFHTQFHCNNFLDTVDRQIEARVDRDTFTVSYRGEPTAIKRYPISVQWPPSPELVGESVEACRRIVRVRHGLPLDHTIGVGVDRLDYTKGIEERLRAVQRFLEQHPEWVGRFSFIQIAAPTRSIIDDYQAYEQRVRSLAARINAQFSSAAHPPIILHAEHHEQRAIYQYFRSAELCFVSSLHDGMNLVAKEFIAARDDDQGVLVLSQFTGAAKELPEAIIVNPYDAEQCADAITQALAMPAHEQRARMRLMRSIVGEFNVFRWAGHMMLDASSVRRRTRMVERFEYRLDVAFARKVPRTRAE